MPKKPVVEDEWDRSERPTLVTCLSCGGNYRILVEDEDTGKYRQTICRHCTCGAMSSAQIAAYNDEKQSKG